MNMAWEKGQKTKSSYLWLAREDVQEFSDALAEAIPEIPWQCCHVENGRHAHAYPSLKQALDCPLGEQNRFSGQAMTLLPFSQGKTIGLLLFNAALVYPKIIVPERDFGMHDTCAYPKQFASVPDSRLAIRWNTTDEDEAICAAIKNQVSRIWKVLHKVTLPVKCHMLTDGSDRSSPQYRIGKHMNDLARRESWCIQQGQFFVLD